MLKKQNTDLQTKPIFFLNIKFRILIKLYFIFQVNDKENETTNKPAEENTELTKSQKKKKKKKEGKGEDSPVKPVAETKTEEVVETKTPKKEATEAKKTPAKTPKRTLKGGIQLEDLKVKKNTPKK